MDELRTVSRDAALAAPLPSSSSGRRTSHSQRRAWLDAGKGLLMHLLVWAGALAMVVPFIWMISTSLKTQAGAMAYPPEWIPNPVHWENYAAVVQSFPFALYAFNSTKIAVLATLGQLASTALAAYAFSRMNFPGRQVIF